MAFDVGAIVGRLELDRKKWEQSIEAVKKDQTSLSGFILKNENQIKSLGKTLTLGGVAITGFFGLMIKGSADAGDYINDLSTRTGIATEILSGYKLTADKTGTSLEGIAVGVKNLANEMSSANEDGKESIKIFDDLKVSYADSTGKLRPLDQVMLDVADKFAAMEDGAAKSTLAWKVFGKTGNEMIPFLNMGRKGLEENAEAARRLGQVWSAEAARKADEFNDSLVELKAGLAGTRNEIAATLLPSVKSLNQTLTNIVVKIRAWAAEHPGLTGWLSKTGLGIGLLMTHVGPLLIALPRVVKGFQTLKELDIATKLKAMNFAFLGIVGGILAAGAAVNWLIGKYKAHQDAEMQTFVKSMGPIREAFLMRRELIKAQIVSHEEWRDIFEKSGRDYGTMLKMISTDPAYAKLKTEWDEIKKSLSAVDKVTLSVTDVFKQFGLKTRTELTKELVDARAALDDLRKSGEATPGAIKTLEDKVKGLKEQLHGASAAQKTFGEVMKEWGILPIKEKTKQISMLLGYEAKLDGMLKAGKLDLTEWGKAVRKVNEELQSLGSQTVNRVLPAARDFHDLISKAPSKFEQCAYAAWTFEGALKRIADQAMVSEATVLRFLWNARADFLRTIGIIVPKWGDISSAAGEMAEDTKTFMQEVSTVVADSMREIARSIAGLIDFKKLFGAAAKEIKFDVSPFNALAEAAKKAYDKIRGLADSEYDAQERQITRAQEDEDRRYKREYDLKVKGIRDSAMTEEQKQAAIEAIDIQYEEAQIARERQREDEKYAREEAQKAKLLALETAHELDLQKIRDDEDKARQKLADDEEKRQNSLWFKVKGIVATACEEITTSFLTKMFEPIGSAIGKLAGKLVGKGTDTVTGALDETGKSVGSLGKTIGDFIGGVGKGIGEFISGLATGVGAAITTIATAIATAVVTLATAIATAATTLAAAAPALLIVGAIAVAIYAGFLQVKTIWDKIAGIGEGDGKSAEWIHEIRDRAYDLNNFMLSTVKPWFATTDKALGGYFEKFDGLKGSLDETRHEVCRRLDDIRDAIVDIGGAQRGAIITRPQLVAVHGTEAAPEVIAPISELRRILATIGPRGTAERRGPAEVYITNEVHLDGIIITDREYARSRLIPELIDALDSNFLKSELQQKLGIA